jgi:hypothetical protein
VQAANKNLCDAGIVSGVASAAEPMAVYAQQNPSARWTPWLITLSHAGADQGPPSSLCLSGSSPGLAESDSLFMGQSAPGYGWFIDSQPAREQVFAVIGDADQLQPNNSRVLGRADSPGALERELGHLLGRDDWDWSDSGLMSGPLGAGVRRNAVVGEVEAVFAGDGFAA